MNQSHPPLRAAIIPVTPLQQNCSLIWCTKTMKVALVDPGGDLDKLKAAVAKTGVQLEKLLVTHGHLDHCGQAGVLAKVTGLLAGAGISIDAVLQREAAEIGGEGSTQTDLIILTHDTREGTLDDAMVELQALPTVLAPIVRLRKEELS